MRRLQDFFYTPRIPLPYWREVQGKSFSLRPGRFVEDIIQSFAQVDKEGAELLLIIAVDFLLIAQDGSISLGPGRVVALDTTSMTSSFTLLCNPFRPSRVYAFNTPS